MDKKKEEFDKMFAAALNKSGVPSDMDIAAQEIIGGIAPLMKIHREVYEAAMKEKYSEMQAVTIASNFVLGMLFPR